jgi:hypothetical protein
MVLDLKQSRKAYRRIWIQLLCQKTWSSRKPAKTPGLRRQFPREDGSGGITGSSRSSRVSKEVDNRGSPKCHPLRKAPSTEG